MKRGFTILFIELFCVQASLFLEALLQKYALFCQIMLLFFSGPHLPQDLPSCQTIAQKCSGRGKISGSSETGTVTERTGAAVCFQKAGDSGIPAVYHPET